MQKKRCKQVHIFTKSGDRVECAKTVQIERRPRQSICVRNTNVLVRVHFSKSTVLTQRHQLKFPSRVNTANANQHASHPSCRDWSRHLGEGHALLNLSNCQRRVQSLGACPRAVKNGVATVQAHAVVEGFLALSHLLVSRVGDPAVRLEKNSGSKVLLLVPPVRGARGRAAGAENAFVETVELLAVLLGLAVLATLARVSILRWRKQVLWRKLTSGAGVERWR
jgi:hypothetical protein